ncbi:MAG: DUF3267 domain-containing protein [Anaerolineae bacterium]|nr:DUF3267 domain-containing protein [Anaerolineae bacterium]
MLNPGANPITELPTDYQEARYMSVNERGVLLWLNILSLIPMLIMGLLIFGVLLVYHEELGAPLVINALPDSTSSTVGLILVLLILPLHEWLHGVVIAHYGHKPRYGIKLFVLFATSDGALFRRNEFIRIALAPLVIITLVGGVIMLFAPMGLATWIALAITLNAAGAIGDLWMTGIALRYDASALIRDEEDSMRIFIRLSVV